MSDDADGMRPNFPPIVRFGIAQVPKIPLPTLDLASQWAKSSIDTRVLENFQRIAKVTAPSAQVLENLQAMARIVEPQAAAFGRIQATLDAVAKISAVPRWADTWSQLIKDLDLGVWAWEPPNWPEEWDMSDEDYEIMNTILNEDGIPLMWVPRGEIVRSLFGATNRSERIAVLLGRRDDIVVDCRAVVDNLAASGRDTTLALEALAAFAGGFHVAAQALAVNVLDHAVVPFVGKHKEVPAKVRIDVLEEGIGLLRLNASLAPLGPAWTPWTPGVGSGAPSDLSRHVTVHGGDPSHYTEVNSLLAQMLMVSVLRGFADWAGRDNREAA
jgi:hypothetical protein